MKRLILGLLLLPIFSFGLLDYPVVEENKEKMDEFCKSIDFSFTEKRTNDKGFTVYEYKQKVTRDTLIFGYKKERLQYNIYMTKSKKRFSDNITRWTAGLSCTVKDADNMTCDKEDGSSMLIKVSEKIYSASAFSEEFNAMLSE